MTSSVHGNGQSQLTPTTYSTALSPEHLKFEDLIERVNISIQNFFPNDGYRYKQVHCLLLSWEADDLGVIDEVKELADVFKDLYGYHSVQRWRIPTQRSYLKLEDTLYQFRKVHSSDDNLLIVYYAGHGYLDDYRLWTWAAYRYFPHFPSRLQAGE